MTSLGTLAPVLVGLLSLVVSVPAAAQAPIPVQLTVSLVRGEAREPVAGLRFWIVAIGSRDSASVTTDATGRANFSLVPARYRIRSQGQVNMEGQRYSWNLTFTVGSARRIDLRLNERNAEAPSVAQAPEAAAQPAPERAVVIEPEPEPLLRPSGESANTRGIELGLGITAGGVTITGGETVFQFAANQQFVSVGLYATPSVAIEPAAAISVTSGGGASITVVQLGLSVPIYARPTWGHSGLFFAPGAAVTILSADASGIGESATQFFIAMGVGSKFRMADPVSLSISGNFAYGFENNTFDDSVTLSAQLGISVFFR